MYAQVEKSKENKSKAVANSVAQKKNIGSQGLGFVDNRPQVIAQRKLQDMAGNSPQNDNLTISTAQGYSGGNILQRALYYYNGVPFSEAEATAWNALVVVAESFGIQANYIETIENDAYSPVPATALGVATTTLSTAIAAHIRTTTIATTTADNFNWGDFHPQLTLMAASHGTLTGPVSTGGHQDDVYTYIVNGDTHRLAEPTNAHGRADGNINTRRQQMRAAIISYNDAVEAAAAVYD
jgi:hypothetical protein